MYHKKNMWCNEDDYGDTASNYSPIVKRGDSKIKYKTKTSFIVVINAYDRSDAAYRKVNFI